jgi:hypothetical protein
MLWMVMPTLDPMPLCICVVFLHAFRAIQYRSLRSPTAEEHRDCCQCKDHERYKRDNSLRQSRRQVTRRGLIEPTDVL